MKPRMLHVEVVANLGECHLASLGGLVREAALADGHEPLGEHKFLRLRQGDDLARAVLAFEDEALAGYAHVITYGEGDERRASCELVVRPAARGRGLGRMMLSHAIMTARQHRARRLDLWSYNDADPDRRMAGQFGLAPVRRLLHLHRHMRALPAESDVEGVTVRAMRPGADDAAWLALNARIFAAHPEQGRWTADDLRARMAQPWFAPEDFLIAECDGSIVGFNWLKIEERPDEGRVGEIYVVGVVPEERGRGLGAMLVARGLRVMRKRGADIAAIYVDESNAAAVKLYASLGFHYHHVDACYAMDLVSRSESASDEAAA